MWNLAQGNEQRGAMRDVMATTLIEMAKTDERIVVLDADLISASGLKAFQNAFPERTIDCGIQEGNMIGVAAGMSEGGTIPFTHSFACFASRKCIDQAFLSACYAGLPVKMIGSDGGVCASVNGGSHQAMEDMGTFYSINNITLVEPSDGAMMANLLPQIAALDGTVYLRSNRKESAPVYADGSQFQLGKGNVLVDGTDATIIASGIEVAQALEAAKMLKEQGLSVRVVDMFTWRPLDHDLVEQCAKETGCIVTAENHCLATGLGHAVSATVVERCPVPMGFIGINESFGEVGSQGYLMERFELSAKHIANKVVETVKRKG